MSARLLLAAAFLGCAQTPPPKVVPPDPEAETRASAESFLTCAERAGAECRAENAPYEGWFSVHLLARLRQDVPTVLLARLPEWLRAARDPSAPRRAFVQALQGWDGLLHDGACVPGRMTKLFPRGVAPLTRAALDRVARLGLLHDDLGGELQTLVQKAQAMGDARVVEVRCARSPQPLFLVLAPEAGAFRPVALEAKHPDPEATRPPPARLTFQTPTGVISPFIPIADEAL